MASSGLTVQVGGASLAQTASTTQTLAGGLAITKGVTEITISAGDADSVTLPAGQPQGTVLYLFNRDSAQDVKVWPNLGATIQGGTASTQTVTFGQTQALICVQAGTDGLTWLAFLGAVCTAA
jgi:hypothetical protein